MQCPWYVYGGTVDEEWFYVAHIFTVGISTFFPFFSNG